MKTFKKKCSACGELKSSNEFYLNKASIDGLVYMCKICYKKYRKKYREKIKKYKKEYYSKNKEYFNIYSRKYNKENREKISEYAKNIRKRRKISLNILAQKKGCAICGGYKGEFVWHHRNPKNKREEIAHMSNWSVNLVKKELKKCDPIHHICHVKLHHYLRGNNINNKKILKGIEMYIKKGGNYG